MSSSLASSATEYTGNCLCGAVSFRVRPDALAPIQVCHCSQCRKAQGGPFATNIPARRSGVEFERGEDQLSGYESSPGKTRFFCKHCGSPIYSAKASLPEVIRLRAGSFNEALPVRPESHGYVGSRCNWWDINDELPKFAGAVGALPDESARAEARLTDIIGIDHIYITVTDMDRAESFYDRVMTTVLGFRKNKFPINGDPHIQYYNRQFGYVIRPARSTRGHDSYSAGLHHFCLRVDSIAGVQKAARALREAGIEATEAKNYPEYAPDYWATFFNDPDGVRLEITNYRQERRDRQDLWDALPQ